MDCWGIQSKIEELEPIEEPVGKQKVLHWKTEEPKGTGDKLPQAMMNTGAFYKEPKTDTTFFFDFSSYSGYNPIDR